MQKIEFTDWENDITIWCPSCGTKNITTVPEWGVVECPHFESTGTILTMGEFDYDRNKIFDAAYGEVYAAKRVVEETEGGAGYDDVAHWLSVLDEKLSDDYVLFTIKDGEANPGWFLYNFGNSL